MLKANGWGWAQSITDSRPMNSTVNLTKEERIQLVLEGVLSADYITYEEIMEVLDTVETLVAERQITHNGPRTLQ